ncbi:hypothetical protein BC826DRAFT_1067439 [Russula brevipes]|nr:hypothetical protein BC826DRAFT_1067439 [Russula brevipes]
MDDAVHALTRTQQVISLAADVLTGGIEEDKLLDLKTRIGSPTADSPPFRVSNLIKYAECLIQPRQENDILGRLLLDCLLQYRALRGGGARLKRAISRENNVEEYDAHAAMILEYMQMFWNDNEGFTTETTTGIPGVAMGRSGYGYGSAPLTAFVYNFDPSLGCDDATFQPCSLRALSSLKVVGDRFKEFSHSAETSRNSSRLITASSRRTK